MRPPYMAVKLKSVFSARNSGLSHSGLIMEMLRGSSVLNSGELGSIYVALSLLLEESYVKLTILWIGDVTTASLPIGTI
jgi:hypothetical protein